MMQIPKGRQSKQHRTWTNDHMSSLLQQQQQPLYMNDRQGYEEHAMNSFGLVADCDGGMGMAGRGVARRRGGVLSLVWRLPLGTHSALFPQERRCSPPSPKEIEWLEGRT